MTTIVGYARVSTFEQLLDLQRDALNAAGCTRIFTDTASGGRSDRSGLQQALDYVREGDVLVSGDWIGWVAPSSTSLRSSPHSMSGASASRA